MQPDVNPGRKRIFKILLHITAWLVLLIVPAWLFFGELVYDPGFLAQYSAQIVFLIIIFYLNYFWFVPSLFFKNKRITYAAVLIAVISLSAIGHIQVHRIFEPRGGRPPHTHLPPYDHNHPGFGKAIRSFDAKPDMPPDGKRPGRKGLDKNYPTYNFVLMAFFVSGMALGLRFSEKLSRNERQREEMEKLKLNAELAYLKNQISPHFFFNTLNNIYSLIEYDPKESQKAIVELSKLMRYLLYETGHETVTLRQEIEFLRHYFELMRLRVDEKVEIRSEFPEHTFDLQIPPLLFLPFVENAFKHGISYKEPSFIEIHMQLHDLSLEFICRNSIGQVMGSVLTESGIGLDNIRKRLNLLFPDTHKLSLSASDKIFSAQLTLNLRDYASNHRSG